MATRFILISATAFAIAPGWHQLYTFAASPGSQLAALATVAAQAKTTSDFGCPIFLPGRAR